MSETIIPVNSRLRKQALLWGIIVAVVGAGGLLVLVVYLEDLTASPQLVPQPAYLRFLAEAGIMVPAFSLAGLLSYLALKISRSGQYPPPGMQVLRDTQIRTGRAARHAARICLLSAIVVVLCGIGMGLIMNWLLAEPSRPSPRPLWQSSAFAQPSVGVRHSTGRKV